MMVVEASLEFRSTAGVQGRARQGMYLYLHNKLGRTVLLLLSGKVMCVCLKCR